MSDDDTPSGLDEKAKALVDAFANEDQDPVIVVEVCRKVEDILTREEKIEYVAVQKKPLINIAPDSVVLTNRRFICYRPKILGRVSFDDYLWRDLYDAQLKEEMLGAALSLRMVNGRRVSVDYLPKAQARKLYAFAQEMEEKVREERRRRELEDKRAAAGGVVVGSGGPLPGSTSADEADPVVRLKKLKEMLDAGLITQGEYDGKRAEIISKM